jgi:hypothetical protein
VRRPSSSRAAPPSRRLGSIPCAIGLLCACLAGAGGGASSPGRAFAGDPAKDEARKAKIEEAKRQIATDREAFQARVNSAIDRGVVWLRGQQRPSGNMPAYGDNLPKNTYQPMDLGVNALTLLTLAKSGVPSDDKALKRLESWCMSDYAKMKGQKWVKTYTAATLLMALDALYNPAPPAPAEPLRDRYGSTPAPPKRPCKYPGGVASTVTELVDFIKRAQVPAVGGWRYPGNSEGAPPGDVDLSNTQYALMALNVAGRCGIHVSPEVYLKALEYVLKEQEREKDAGPAELWIENPAWEPGFDDPPRFLSAGKAKARGWTYLQGLKEPCTGSMTVAGVTCLAIVKERLADAGKLTPETGHRIDRALLDGLGWLGEAFTVEDNPVVPAAPAMWHYYYLYGLERIGSLTGVKWFDKHDWYREGADHLLGAQQKEGGWQSAADRDKTKPADNTESAVVQTCFALLFLKRATTPPAVPVTPQSLTGPSDAPPDDGRGR